MDSTQLIIIGALALFLAALPLMLLARLLKAVQRSNELLLAVREETAALGVELRKLPQ